jgi:hypothetical protein
VANVGRQRANAETDMCDKCIELDDKMEHYRGIASRITDQLTLDRIEEAIAELENEKAALHSERKS